MFAVKFTGKTGSSCLALLHRYEFGCSFGFNPHFSSSPLCPHFPPPTAPLSSNSIARNQFSTSKHLHLPKFPCWMMLVNICLQNWYHIYYNVSKTWSSLTSWGPKCVLGVLLDEAIEVVRSVLALALDVLLVVLSGWKATPWVKLRFIWISGDLYGFIRISGNGLWSSHHFCK